VIWCEVCRCDHPAWSGGDNRADLQAMPPEEVRAHKRNMTARSRQRSANLEGKIRGRAIDLAARYVRERHPMVWSECMVEARQHVRRQRGAARLDGLTK
jgi:hypothetical protein